MIADERTYEGGEEKRKEPQKGKNGRKRGKNLSEDQRQLNNHGLSLMEKGETKSPFLQKHNQV